MNLSSGNLMAYAVSAEDRSTVDLYVKLLGNQIEKKYSS